MRKGWNVNPDGGDNIRQILEKTEVTIKNGQSQRHRQYWATQSSCCLTPNNLLAISLARTIYIQ
jgi:hypothetical protein